MIASTLSSITALGSNVELIVVDGGSADRTVGIAMQNGARVVESSRGRARQMNSGAGMAHGDVLLFLHADTIPPKGTIAAIGKALEDPRVGGGSFRLKFDSDNFVLRCCASLSRFKSPFFHYGDSGYFVRRSVFDEMGGFRDIPILEDLDFYLRLSRCARIAIVQEPVVTSARRLVSRGVLKQQLLGCLLVFLYLLKVPPRTLKTIYDWGQ